MGSGGANEDGDLEKAGQDNGSGKDVQTELEAEQQRSSTGGDNEDMNNRQEKGEDLTESRKSKQVMSTEGYSAAWKNNVLARTNELFVLLNITTQPIRSFEELQRSASSMFVGIFETMFNVRLKHVIRTPRVVTDYITNARLVINALSESLQIDLKHLSGEAIYRGDPAQIHELLCLFEELWEHLFENPFPGTPKNISGISPKSLDSGTGLGEETSPEQGELRRFGSPDRSGSMISPFKTGRTTPLVGSSKAKTSPRLALKSTKSNKKEKTEHVAKTKTKSTGSKTKPLAKKRVQVPKSKPAIPKTRTMLKKPALVQKKPASKTNDGKANKKKRPEITNPTPGAESLIRATDLVRNVGKTRKDEMAEFERQVREKGLENLARQYPSAYRQAVLHQGRKKPQAAKSLHNPPLGKNAMAKRMEEDLEKYRKAYQILIKQHANELRYKAEQSKRRAKLLLRGMNQDKRVDEIRTERLHEDLKREEKAKVMERASREEVLVKRMFQDALKLEHERILAQKRAQEDLQRQLDEEQLNRYESLQQQLMDQENMMKETLANHLREEKITRVEQRVALRELGVSLRNDYQNKLNSLHMEWEQNNQHYLFTNKERISAKFDDLNTTLGDVGAKQIRNIMMKSF